jgi:hypothetical protein
MVTHISTHISDVVKVAGQSVDRATLTGLQNASEKSGVSFQYLVAKAAQESSLQSDAQADTSSATGLFQFTRGTWLDMMKKYGALYGYGDLTQKISATSDGKPAVKDHVAEQRILALRNNPEAAALMAAEYARDNAMSLHDALGRGVDASDLYLAHFLGPSGARQLLSTASTTPSTSAASILPAAAKANASVFYTAEGHARTAAEVVKLVRERFMGQMDRYADMAIALTGQNEGQSVVTDETAATTSGRAAPYDLSKVAARPETEHSDTSKAMISHFVLEEMAKLIAAKPMTMADGEEEETDETALSSAGFQSADWAAAMAQAATKTDRSGDAQAALERSTAKNRAGDAMRTYDMLNAVPGAPFIPVRRSDPS